MPKKLFISYAHKDIGRVQPLAQDLQRLGFEVWMDNRNLQAGDQWRQEITNAINQCEDFLLFLSDASVQSADVRRELDLASDKKKRLIPLLLEQVKIPASMQYQLAGIQWISLDHPEAAFNKLLIALGEKAISDPHAQNPSKEESASPDKSSASDQRSGGVYFNNSEVIIKGDVVGRHQKKSNK
jgi:hypothetical protein